MNEDILSELFNIKSDLANREKDLDAREYGLSLRQSNFGGLQENIQSTLAAHAKKLYKDAAAKLAPKVNAKFEKIKTLERSINDKINLFKAKQRQDKTRAAKEATAESAKFRSRIRNLEKNNEIHKARVSTLESELKSEKERSKKLTELVQQLKSKNSLLDSKLKIELTEPKVKVPSPIRLEETLALTPEPKLPPKSDVLLFLNIQHKIVSCLRLTLPLFTGGRFPDENPLTQSIASIASARSESAPNIGEMLFPVFNTLVPQLVETLPFLQKVATPDIYNTFMLLLWDMISYTLGADLRGSDSHMFIPENL